MMATRLSFKDISIRTALKPGDLGFVIYRHGVLYAEENGYGIAFEAYVAEGLGEFYHSYDAEKDRVWICEDARGAIVGFLLLRHRAERAAQLRYFYLEPEARGIGLGGFLMRLFMDFLKEKNYRRAYLWTTNEQIAAALYERYGFELTEEKDSKAFGKDLIEQRYDLELENYES